MRELNEAELDCVYGGQSGDDIYVNGKPKKGVHDPGEPEFPVTPSSPGDPHGGGGANVGSNIPHPDPNDPAVKSVNRSDLSPSSAIDLSSVTVEKVTLGNHTFNLITDLKTLPLYSDQRTALVNMMWSFNTAYDKLTASAKEAINSLDNIVISDLPGRSFSLEDKHSFFFDYSEIAVESGSQAASNILHDARVRTH